MFLPSLNQIKIKYNCTRSHSNDLPLGQLDEPYVSLVAVFQDDPDTFYSFKYQIKEGNCPVQSDKTWQDCDYNDSAQAVSVLTVSEPPVFSAKFTKGCLNLTPTLPWHSTASCWAVIEGEASHSPPSPGSHLFNVKTLASCMQFEH